MANRWIEKLVPIRRKNEKSWLRSLVSGGLYRLDGLKGDSSLANIQVQINTMRALARDSQISTALSYYATDATTRNTAGQIIWAAPIDANHQEVADVINGLFKRWKVTSYARDHILELATIGNLYIPTTDFYKPQPGNANRVGVVLDNNTIISEDYDIIPSTKIPPEEIVHLWYQGQPRGFIANIDGQGRQAPWIMPESSCIHFALGGLIGDYSLDTQDKEGNSITYDIKFAQPLMERAVQPTQTLSLLEDSVLLSSLARTIKFIHVRCGDDEEEMRDALQQIKDAIEQQLSINTASGDTQSYVNPQSPNNMIYLPYVNDAEALTITDLNMSEATDADNKLLEHYQDKKLSVLGVPKEAMNFSSNEGLGGAGSVLSQRSALYANSLERLEAAYIEGWTDGINKYFMSRNMSGFVDKFILHMTPIETTHSTIQFEKRDAALSQAQALVDLFKGLGVDKSDAYRDALKEILIQVFPEMGASVGNLMIDLESDEEAGGGF